ncbi:MAG: metallophosphoesterase family protein [Candidatus Bathyarchaeia archaeon]
MKIIAGTDFHGSRGAIEAFAKNIRQHGVDLAVMCGDITNFGTVEEARILLGTLTENSAPIIFVPGNCDPPSLINLRLNGLTCIHGEVFLYNNLAFVGLGGGAISPFNTPFEMSEEEIAGILHKCSENLRRLEQQACIILVSHTPPKNTRLDRTFLGVHAGSISVRKFIEENKPILVLCGHIHEAKGSDRIGNSIIVNPGPAKQGNYALITLEDGEVKVELKQKQF